MAVKSYLVSRYAYNIYVYGTTRFESVTLEYHEPVKQFAAANFYPYEIQNALTQGWINQEQYDQTMAYRTDLSPNDPLASPDAAQ